MTNKTKVNVGDTIGYLTVVSQLESYISPSGKTKKSQWQCKCKCGNIVNKIGDKLNPNNKESSVVCSRQCPYRKKYGDVKAEDIPEYRTWVSMKQRCYNPTHTSYKNYGGRGITVCNKWLNSYTEFINDLGSKPNQEAELERINVNGNYEPSNCKWLSHKKQHANKRNNKLTQALADQIKSEYVPYVITQKMLAEKYNVSITTIRHIIINKIW